jgi:hypothetical protein
MTEGLYVQARKQFGSDVIGYQLYVIKKILISMDKLIISQLSEVCTPTTCPKMIASDEWHFLCAPHSDKPRDCCAIDYMKHTVDSCTSTLMVAVSGSSSSSSMSKQFNSIMRRIFRIFGHLYFHHPKFFKSVTTECIRTYLFLKDVGLWKPDMAIIPESVIEKLISTPAGTIVDLRTVTMQLSQDDDDAASDSTVIMDS